MKKQKIPQKISQKVKFIEYVASESVALVFDIILLWVFVRFFGLNYLIAAAIAYIIAIMIHYHTTRHHIFKGTVRTEFSGLPYFIAVGVGGLIIALLMINFIVQAASIDYLFARLIATIAIIPATYVSNKYITFIMPHQLPDEKNLYCNIPDAHGD
jgi:putative flippase GtrA